ncbi:hypothetical protein RQP46_009488 [Phenoliferia psychrophenolica]
MHNGSYLITPEWQTGLSNGVQVGSILGLLINGWACDRYGYRLTCGACLVAMTAAIGILFSARSIEVLSVAYSADISPAALRPFLTTYVNLCWVIGQFIAAGVLKATDFNGCGEHVFFCGAAFGGFSTIFFVQAGLSVSNAFSMTLINYAIGGLGTISSWWTLNYVFSVIYQSTVGPTCYCLVAEMPSTRLRAKTVVLARITYNVLAIIVAILFPKVSPRAF